MASTSKQPAAKRAPSAEQVAAAILKKHRGPMRVADLTAAVVKSGKAAGLKGKTPEATISAHIYVAAKAGRVFKKVDRGVVDLIERTG